METTTIVFLIKRGIIIFSAIISFLFFDFMMYVSPPPVQPFDDPLLVIRHNPEKLRLDSFYVQRYLTTRPLTVDEIYKNLPGNFPASIFYCLKDEVGFPYREFCKQHDQALRDYQWFSFYENKDKFFDELKLRIRMKSEFPLTREVLITNEDEVSLYSELELPAGWMVVAGCKKPK